MKAEYVLLSHGNLSSGMKHTVEMILGETPNLHSIGMQAEEGVDILYKNLNELMEQHIGAKFILITDLFGGSVNNKLYEQFQSNPDVEIVTGMNLSLVLELLLQTEVIDENIRFAVHNAKESILYMKDIVIENSDDEE